MFFFFCFHYKAVVDRQCIQSKRLSKQWNVKKKKVSNGYSDPKFLLKILKFMEKFTIIQKSEQTILCSQDARPWHAEILRLRNDRKEQWVHFCLLLSCPTLMGLDDPACRCSITASHYAFNWKFSDGFHAWPAWAVLLRIPHTDLIRSSTEGTGRVFYRLDRRYIMRG